MTGAAGRWSRAAARDRWAELQIFVDRPLGIGLMVVSLWPLVTLVRSIGVYRQPLVAVAVYVASVVLLALLWWRGRVGIGVGTSIGCGLAVVTLNLILTFEVPPGVPGGAALWLHGSAVAIPMVLAFSRPIEEPLAVLGALAASNVVAVERGASGVAALHDAPLHLGIPVAITVSCLVLVGALRESVAGARKLREQAAELLQRERVAEAVGRARSRRLGRWEEEAAQLLQALGEGNRLIDPSAQVSARELAAAARAALGDDESILWSMIPADLPGDVVVRDLDVGHRLRPVDRVQFVQRVTDLGRHPGGRIEITLQPADAPGDDVKDVLIVIAATDVPLPEHTDDGTVIVESSQRWFLELTLPVATGQPSR